MSSKRIFSSLFLFSIRIYLKICEKFADEGNLKKSLQILLEASNFSESPFAKIQWLYITGSILFEISLNCGYFDFAQSVLRELEALILHNRTIDIVFRIDVLFMKVQSLIVIEQDYSSAITSLQKILEECSTQELDLQATTALLLLSKCYSVGFSFLNIFLKLTIIR